jgi:hypothetical protein
MELHHNAFLSTIKPPHDAIFDRKAAACVDLPWWYHFWDAERWEGV